MVINMSDKNISVVIPTYQEVENIPLIAEEINTALAGESFEIIFVDDDSQDGSFDAVTKVAHEIPARIIVRTEERGLSTAVIRGIEEAVGKYIVVMDCDLSHPATAIPHMVEKLKANEADFVVGSRYVKGGSFDEDWGFFRLLNSKVATWLALPLCHVKDPMSGFFSTTPNMASTDRSGAGAPRVKCGASAMRRACPWELKMRPSMRSHCLAACSARLC